MSSLPIHREAYLWKVGGSIRTWKRRFMVLNSRTLTYYKHAKDAQGGTPQGVIQLDGASIAALLQNNEFSSSSADHSTALFGITPSGSTRVYVIQAGSPEERDAWIADCVTAGAFKILLTPLSAKTQADSLLEGWIDKQSTQRFGLFGGSTERVYAALFHDKLAIWKTVQTSTAPMDQVLLTRDSKLLPLKLGFELVGAIGEPKWTILADTPQIKIDWVDAISATIEGRRYDHPAYMAARGSLLTQANARVSAAAALAQPNVSASPANAASAPSPSPSSSTSSSAAAAAASSSSALHNAHAKARQSTKLRNRIVEDVGSNSDASEEEEEEVGKVGAAAAVSATTRHGGHDEDDSDEEEQGDAATAKNADIAEAVDFVDLSSAEPPPADEEESMAPPPPPAEAEDASDLQPAADGDMDALTAQPDVLLQLNAILASRFHGDASSMQAYLDRFTKSVLVAAPSVSADFDPQLLTMAGGRKLSTKLSKVHATRADYKPTRMLHVHLLEARDLPAMDSNGFSDPYAVLHIRGASHKKKDVLGAPVKSKTIPETLDPIWDQQLTLDLASGAEELVIDIYDLDRFSTDDFIGRAVVPLHSLQRHHQGISGWFTLGGIPDPWASVGSVFLGIVLDEHYVDAASRSQSQAFMQARAQCLLIQEQRYFSAQLGAPTNSLAMTPSASPAAAASLTPLARTPSAPLDEKLKVFVGTWNVGNAPPPDDLSPFIPLYQSDIYVISAQECAYEPRRDLKTCKVDWQCCLVRHFGRDYTLVRYHSLWEIRLAVFVHNRLVPDITNVHAYQEATGIGNVLGNKGAVVIALQYKSVKLAFVGSHLAAHQNTCSLRNDNYRTIVRNVHVGPMGQSDLLNEYHHVIWSGDLNYRVDYGNQESKSPTAELFKEMTNFIHSGIPSELHELWQFDQLTREIKEKRAFVGFREGAYNFPPTFKVKRNSRLEYTSQRSPAWCDRVLYRSVPGYSLDQVSLGYARAMATSDHKPVVTVLELGVPSIPSPLDRSLGESVIRLHDLRCSMLRVPDAKGDAVAHAKDIDPHLVFLASFLHKPITTPVVRKTVSPQWLDLAHSPGSVNEIRRIRQTLLYVRVLNHQDQDKVVGRAIISLNDLEPTEPVPPSGDTRGLPQAQRFAVEFTFGGMPAGSLTGQISIAWKAKAKK